MTETGGADRPKPTERSHAGQPSAGAAGEEARGTGLIHGAAGGGSILSLTRSGIDDLAAWRSRLAGKPGTRIRSSPRSSRTTVPRLGAAKDHSLVTKMISAAVEGEIGIIGFSQGAGIREYWGPPHATDRGAGPEGA